MASRLAKGLSAGWEIAHKTWLLRQACHDSAIFLMPRGDYALIVLTGQNRNRKAAKDFISRLGRVTFRHYRGLHLSRQGPQAPQPDRPALSDDAARANLSPQVLGP